MTRLLLVASLVASIVLVAPGVRFVDAQRGELTDLAVIYNSASGVTRDSNGDALPDTVAARVILPDEPTIEDIQAGANIATRIGFETIALTLPIVVKAGAIASPQSVAFPILVGRSNRFVKTLIDRGAIDPTALKPGQGLITVARSPLGGGDGVVVIGGDDEGTLAAANVLAGNLPRVWGASGARLAQVQTHVVRYLKTQGISATARGIGAIVVDSDRRGIATLVTRVEVGGGDANRALTAIRELDAAHRRGQDADTLSFTNTAATHVEVWSGARKVGEAAVRRAGLNSRTLTPPQEDEDQPPPAGRGGGGDTPGQPAQQQEPGGGGGRGGPEPAPAKTFTLANAYSLEGWFGDSFVDLIPDRLETSLVVGDAADSFGAAHIATRLGLESTGVTLPLARPAKKVTAPEREPNPILVGRTNDLVRELVKIGKVRLDDLKPGEGIVQTVPRAFGPATATVVAGADPAGTDAAAMYLARRAPFVWDNRRGALRLQDAVDAATDFFNARAGAAHAALAMRELDEVIESLEGKTIESFEAKVYLEEANPQFDTFLAARAKGKLAALKHAVAPAVSSQGITDAVPVFEDKLEIPWEVDEFWTKFKTDVLPKVQPGSAVSIEARLSESPQVRRRIADEAQAMLVKAGARNPRVQILSAYKQGFLWFTEQVMPELKGKSVRAVNVKIATHKPDLTKKFRFYTLPSRWLHELYPLDDVLERDLGIAKSAVTLELAEDTKDIYTVEATNATGQVVHRATFSPKIVEREYLEKFPGWSRVEVTTGWLTASVNDQTVVDARIATDPERFWDHYQGKVLTRIYDHVMRITENRPTADKQPFHRDLDVEVWMSEPDYRIGIDEEQISALEALHEDLYFVTLDFFTALGRTTTRARLNAPGKIYPIIHPERAGKPGEARILYAGNASTRARLEVSYKEKGVERPTRVRRDLTPIGVSAPSVHRAIARADALSELEFQVEPRDDREAARAADALDNLVTLHAAGLYRTDLAFEHVDRVAVALIQREARARRVVPATGAWKPSHVRTATGKPRKLPLVTWDHVIGPDESESLVGQLAAFPEIKAYKAGESYRKRDVSVMEITLPTASELIAVKKYAAYKPTIFITGRQHANEVSSTSHILKLAELLATDSSYRDILKKVNIVLHPVENPDGAQMAYELQKLTPTHMLHAGRYSALGADVGGANPLLPESQVRGAIWREWLPDIYLNPHGYPSHEWVQQFAGYVSPQFRAYWSTRGWYTQLGGTRDPRHPELMSSTEALRENIVREINANTDVRAMNLRHQARYRKWAYGFAPHVFTQEIYKDTAIYFTDPESGEVRGNRRIAAPRPGTSSARATMNQWPQVTFNIGMTEAPDETAQGEWLNLVTKAGFSFLMAHVKYLRDGHYEIERIEEAGQRDAVSITNLRIRPVRPGRNPNGTTTSSSNGAGK